MLSLNVIRYGSETPPPTPVLLTAGPLSLRYEDGELRSIRLGEHEILRRVYVAVRDHNWGTILPTFSDVAIERGDDSFAVSFTATHREGPIDFSWRGTITGDARGTIRFAMAGTAHTTFLRNRIGFCVLHPPASCAGQRCTVEHDDGTRTEGMFPQAIAPNQPFFEMRAITHDVVPGVRAEVRFAGDIFEMEDQRNWTDDSYKTYCTPLRLPYPAEVLAGTKIAQSVTLTLDGAGSLDTSAALRGPLAVTVEADAIGTLPQLGLGVASHAQPLTEQELARLRSLNLAHLRVDLHLAEADWREPLQRATEEAAALGVALEVALFLSLEGAADQLAALAEACATFAPSVVRWLVFDTDRAVTSARTLALARQPLETIAPGATLGGGTNAYFTQLNRDRPDSAALDFVTYSVNPQVHAFDDGSLIETLACQATTVESTRLFIGDLPIVISPVTLRPRFNPDATTAPAEVAFDALPDTVDPRQMSLFGAAWTVGSLAALASSGVSSATYYETTGPRGVMEIAEDSPWPAFPSIPGGVFPLYHVLADVGEFAGGEVLRATTSDQLGAAVLALRLGERIRILVANLCPERQQIALDLPEKRVYMRLLNETNAESAMREPEEFRLPVGEFRQVWEDSFLLDLPPYAVACINDTGDLKKRMSLADVLVRLRDDIVEARQQGDASSLTRLQAVMSELNEIAEHFGDRKIVVVTDNLNDSIHDWFYGASFKSTIPTPQDIRAFLEDKEWDLPYWAY